MADIKCTGCGTDISDQAPACPICGYPMHMKRSVVSDVLLAPPESSVSKQIRTSSPRRILKVTTIAVVIYGLLVIVFLYSFRLPAANAFLQKVLDSYSSAGMVQTIMNIPTFIAGGVIPTQNTRINTNSRVASPAQQPPTTTASVKIGNNTTGSNQQKIPVAPKPPALTYQSTIPNQQEPCSARAADWINRENNGNPNGNQESSGENGTTTFTGNVKISLYKTFNTPSSSCLFAEYTVWTQSTGQVWEQKLDIASSSNPNVPIWMQDVQPAESQQAMLNELDAAINSIEQTGQGPQQLPPQAPSLPQISISEQSLVALLCHYSDGSEARGSGVIINSQGYILTAKHVVDPSWTSWAYGGTPTNATLNYCEVGIPPEDSLPTLQEIQTVNPSIMVSLPFPFEATLSFEPSQGQMSDNEYKHLDFAILKIDKLGSCVTYPACTLPTSYPYNPVLYADAPAAESYLFNFGYPYEVASSTANNFDFYYLKGAAGRLTQYYGGDQYFKNQPLDFSWSGIDVLHGRSGSPMFWDGYAIGIVVANEADNTTNDLAVGLPAIEEILKNNGLGSLLSTN